MRRGRDPMTLSTATMASSIGPVLQARDTNTDVLGRYYSYADSLMPHSLSRGQKLPVYSLCYVHAVPIF
ncbi:hypothetical protein TELCIR_01853 [Teladorsagia circumcincta]|uniref:Uncharacterized protein n=1 Tax=Teladorsagia circumcincta TaxID=45464 RepID=A0A2G9V0S6_TELCI|nr:hypothetical protein TELCIR_01853 [Teladorsagia circumcincta]